VLSPAISFLCRIELSTTNPFSLSDYVVNSESVFYAKFGDNSELVSSSEFLWRRRISFRCRIVLSIANQFSLPNSGVSSKSVFTVELCCSS